MSSAPLTPTFTPSPVKEKRREKARASNGNSRKEPPPPARSDRDGRLSSSSSSSSSSRPMQQPQSTSSTSHDPTHTPRGRRAVPKISGDQVIQHLGGKRSLLISEEELTVICDASVLPKLRWHSANRDINVGHVQQLKMRMAMSLLQPVSEPIKLMVALVKTDMADHLEDPSEEFRLPVLDGQHRWTALRELLADAPNPDALASRVVVCLTVYLCDDDDHLTRRLSMINFTCKWNSADAETVKVRATFLAALDAVLGDEWGKRKPSKQVALSPVLRDEKWSRSLWGVPQEWFEERIREVSQSEAAEAWQEALQELPKKQVLRQAIEATQLWQLADLKHEWIRLIKRGQQAASPKRSKGAKRARRGEDEE